MLLPPYHSSIAMQKVILVQDRGLSHLWIFFNPGSISCIAKCSTCYTHYPYLPTFPYCSLKWKPYFFLSLNRQQSICLGESKTIWVQLTWPKFCTPFDVCSAGISAGTHITLLLLVSGVIRTYTCKPIHENVGNNTIFIWDYWSVVCIASTNRVLRSIQVLRTVPDVSCFPTYSPNTALNRSKDCTSIS